MVTLPHVGPVRNAERRVTRDVPRRVHPAWAWLWIALTPASLYLGAAAMSLVARLLGVDPLAPGTYGWWQNAVLTLVAAAVSALAPLAGLRAGVRAARARGPGAGWGVGAAVTAVVLLGFLLVGTVTSLAAG